MSSDMIRCGGVDSPYKEDSLEELDCICIEELTSNPELTVILECRHLFHKECLEEWLAKKPNTCPICKGDTRCKVDINIEDPELSFDQLANFWEWLDNLSYEITIEDGGEEITRNVSPTCTLQQVVDGIATRSPEYQLSKDGNIIENYRQPICRFLRDKSRLKINYKQEYTVTDGSQTETFMFFETDLVSQLKNQVSKRFPEYSDKEGYLLAEVKDEEDEEVDLEAEDEEVDLEDEDEEVDLEDEDEEVDLEDADVSDLFIVEKKPLLPWPLWPRDGKTREEMYKEEIKKEYPILNKWPSLWKAGIRSIEKSQPLERVHGSRSYRPEYYVLYNGEASFEPYLLKDLPKKTKIARHDRALELQLKIFLPITKYSPFSYTPYIICRFAVDPNTPFDQKDVKQRLESLDLTALKGYLESSDNFTELSVHVPVAKKDKPIFKDVAEGDGLYNNIIYLDGAILTDEDPIEKVNVEYKGKRYPIEINFKKLIVDLFETIYQTLGTKDVDLSPEGQESLYGLYLYPSARIETLIKNDDVIIATDYAQLKQEVQYEEDDDDDDTDYDPLEDILIRR